MARRNLSPAPLSKKLSFGEDFALTCTVWGSHMSLFSLSHRLGTLLLLAGLALDSSTLVHSLH